MEKGLQIRRERLMWIAALALGELAEIDGDDEDPGLRAARDSLSARLGRDPEGDPTAGASALTRS